MTAIRYEGDALWDRIELAVDKVKDRLERATRALDAEGVAYAVIGGNAVQLWVAQIDVTATRATRDVDLLVRLEDLPRATAALTAAGFSYRQTADVRMFLDGPEASARDAIHVILAGTKVRPEYAVPAPDVTESIRMGDTNVLTLEALVRMKLTSFRDKDRVHLRDLVELGAVDRSWIARLPAELGDRLQSLVDSPDG